MYVLQCKALFKDGIFLRNMVYGPIHNYFWKYISIFFKAILRENTKYYTSKLIFNDLQKIDLGHEL